VIATYIELLLLARHCANLNGLTFICDKNYFMDEALKFKEIK
jgi:hypothetical protein